MVLSMGAIPSMHSGERRVTADLSRRFDGQR
jgi:hypothetical protein